MAAESYIASREAPIIEREEAPALTRRRRRRADASTIALGTIAVLVLGFLYLPVMVLIVFSFNDNSVMTLPLHGFTLDWYRKLFANDEMLRAIGNSFYVATFATILTTLIGVPAAFALDRADFPGKALFRRVVLLPLTLPGIITGISMLQMFHLLGFTLSLTTVIMGHATALIAIVLTQVFARLQHFNRRWEEASSDLGGHPWQTFVFITLPNIRSALVGSALLAFTLSFDEIPVTFFLTGRENTLPMYIYSTLRRGFTPEINAIATIIVVVSLGVILLSIRLLRSDD